MRSVGKDIVRGPGLRNRKVVRGEDGWIEPVVHNQLKLTVCGRI
ncbi:MAG: hypothetical protein QOF51_175 [Chloroflexota bacterium]|nr:hypothetical protein [Chloroflexota bacterium]